MCGLTECGCFYPPDLYLYKLPYGSISCMAVFFCISKKNPDNFRLIILKI